MSRRLRRGEAHYIADQVDLPGINIVRPKNLHVTDRIVLYWSGFSEVGKASIKSSVIV